MDKENPFRSVYNYLLDAINPSKKNQGLKLALSNTSVSISAHCLNSRRVEIRGDNGTYIVEGFSKHGFEEQSYKATLDKGTVTKLLDKYSSIKLPPKREPTAYCDGANKELVILLDGELSLVDWVSSPLEVGYEELDKFSEEVFSLGGIEKAPQVDVKKESTESFIQVDHENRTNVCERSYSEISTGDLVELYHGSVDRLNEYFLHGEGQKWLEFYDIEHPIAVALCQGAALHYHDKSNGVKDFDVWFFYPFNERHLPYRTYWNWDYKNPKFGRHPDMPEYVGRKVDVLVRSIKNYSVGEPEETIKKFLKYENTTSSKELAKKGVVMLYPESTNGKVVWYMGKPT